ncbi:PTP1 [[Candida] subhashii]|uniref:PTP1 n=1 Tax=[Candida] subhashii TaxID=561895 RepID=A0A8J5QCL5_9ASCO|nr:PTP1 [[Candida] subhashii]KAG7660987.1 PTP1 [[Candida] subhashii]
MVKCDRYWPELNEEWNFNDQNIKDGIDIPNLSIKNIDETLDSNGDYILTTMELTSNETVKRVYHFYYFKWADAKVPPSIEPLYNISEDIENIRQMSSNPPPIPIVHCSAGVGRSGTFIAFDYLFRDSNKFIDLLSKKDYDDDDGPGSDNDDPIYQTVYELRAHRMMMVQTIYQYNFLYETARGVYNKRRRSPV